MPSVFQVTALWDTEAQVFHSKSDIPGLVIEAETFDEFVKLVHDLAPEIIGHNVPGAASPYRVHVLAERALLLDAA